jgi:hypothetical protein
MAKKLLGSGSSKKSNSPKGMGGRSLTEQNASPAYRGTPEAVAAREYEAVKGKRLHDQLKKNKSSGLKP